MENILPLIQAHWPIVMSVLIVPGLRKLKNKIQKDIPALWWGISITTSVLVALGGSAAIGVDAGTAQLNAVLTALMTQLIHTGQKTKKKLNGN